MKILVSQREIQIKNLMGHTMFLDGLERDWYRFLKSHTVIPFPNMFDFDQVPDFDCLLIPGGPDSVARHLTENALFACALKQNKPIVGICHGAFVVNDLTGGINGEIAGHGGTVHDIRMENKTFTVNSYHSQTIQSLGPDMTIIATDLEDNIEAFQHKQLPIYGVVWHPERMNHPVLPKAVETLLS